MLGLLAGEGDFGKSLCIAVNCGNDTDTVAAMAGYIVGALNGAPAYDSYYYDTLEAANHFDLRSLAHEMAACAARN